MTKQSNAETNNVRDRVFELILIIIITFLLLHNCELINKKYEDGNGKVNIIDITRNDQCEQDTVAIDCLQDEKNSKCIVPNFVGKNKKDVLKWLNSISNTIELEIKLAEKQGVKDGTVIEQSLVGESIKELLNGKKKLVITIVNNGSLIDCEKDTQNSKCKLPNFVGEEEDDVEDWLGELANNIKVKYVYVDSSKKPGTITNQSLKPGRAVKDILDKDQTLIIYISRGKKTAPNNNNNNQGGNNTTPDKTNPNQQQDTQEPDEDLDDDFYVNDRDVVKWEDVSQIKVFEDSTYIAKVNGTIAPESSGTYKFVVNNGTNYNLKYKITFTENNIHNMNMKFKLKKGDTYLIDHYVSYDELNISNMTLNVRNSEDYYLEWKWVGDNDNDDTSIGTDANNGDIEYSLNIKVEAESI